MRECHPSQRLSGASTRTRCRAGCAVRSSSRHEYHVGLSRHSACCRGCKQSGPTSRSSRYDQDGFVPAPAADRGERLPLDAPGSRATAVRCAGSEKPGPSGSSSAGCAKQRSRRAALAGWRRGRYVRYRRPCKRSPPPPGPPRSACYASPQDTPPQRMCLTLPDGSKPPWASVRECPRGRSYGSTSRMCRTSSRSIALVTARGFQSWKPTA